MKTVPHNLSMFALLPPENRLAGLADEVVFGVDSSSAPSDLTGSEYKPEVNLKPILFFSGTIKRSYKRPSTF